MFFEISQLWWMKNNYLVKKLINTISQEFEFTRVNVLAIFGPKYDQYFSLDFFIFSLLFVYEWKNNFFLPSNKLLFQQLSLPLSGQSWNLLLEEESFGPCQLLLRRLHRLPGRDWHLPNCQRFPALWRKISALTEQALSWSREII